jgi:hypothetical protein
MRRNSLFAVLLVAALVPVSLWAQGTQVKAPAYINSKILGDFHQKNGNPDILPSYCNPCLFYGGDWDPNSSVWVAYANWDTIALGQATVYVPFVVPAGHTWTVTGLFTNNLALNINTIDPATAAWSISSGVSKGNPGTTIASGTAAATFNPTGRNYQNTYYEYTALVNIPAVPLQGGTYWLSVVPPCTNSNDASCGSAAYYITDSTSRTNAGGPPEPAHRSFTNAPNFGFNYINLCSPEEGYYPPSCSVMSAGVLGTHN